MPTKAALSTGINSWLESEITPLIDTLVESKISFKNEFFKILKLIINNPAYDNTPVNRSLINLALMQAIMNQLNAEEMNSLFQAGPNGETLVNKEAFFSKFPKLNNKEGSLLILALESYIKDKRIQYLNIFDSNMTMKQFLNIQSKDGRDLLSLSKSMSELIDSLDSKGLGFFVPYSNRAMVKSVRKTGQISSLKHTEFIDLFCLLYRLLVILDSDLFSIFSAPVLTMEQIDSITQVKEVVTRTNNFLGSPVKMASIKQKLKDEWKKSIRHLIASGVTPEEEKTFQDTVEKVRHRAVQLIEEKSLASNLESLQKVRNAILKTKIVSPMTQSELQGQVKDQLQNEGLDSLKQFHSLLEKKSKEPLLLAILFNLPKSLQEEDLVNINDYIEEYRPAEVKAVIDTSLNQISLGWQAAKDLRYGVGLLAHEFGHLVSDKLNFDNKALKEAKTCTVNRHELSETLVDPSAPFFQAEEGWADAFSAAVAASFLDNETIKPLNLSCLFLSWDRKNHSYNFLRLKNWYHGEVHSSSLYRLIQTQIDMKQPLPESCVRATGLPQTSPFFKSCF